MTTENSRRAPMLTCTEPARAFWGVNSLCQQVNCRFRGLTRARLQNSVLTMRTWCTSPK